MTDTIYYKATKTDGSSFNASPDGTRPIYAPGFTYTIPKNERRPQMCSSGVLHASDVPAETLIGGSWPCRLFEVTGKPVVGPEGHKFGFYSFDVVREIEAWRALGPNGLEVAAFIAAVRGTNAKQQRGVAAARAAAWDALATSSPTTNSRCSTRLGRRSSRLMTSARGIRSKHGDWHDRHLFSR